MKFRKPLGLIMAATAIMAAAPAFEVQAQTATPTSTPVAPAVKSALTCTLGKTNCTLLATAEANAASETSFLQSISFKMALTENGVSPINVQATGLGAFSIDPTVNVLDTNALYKAIQFQLNMTGSAAKQSGKFGVVIKNGVLYIQDPQTLSWLGVDLIQLTATVKQAQSSSQAANNQALQKVLQALANDPEVQTALSSLSKTPGWITQERLPTDAVLEGQRMAQIQYIYNPQVLFSTPEFAMVFKKFVVAIANNFPVGTQNGDSARALARMTNLQTQGMFMLLGGALGNTTLKVIRWIGETDKKIHALHLTVNLNLVLSALTFSSTTATPSPPINGTIDFSVQLTKIGQPIAITAPANAMLLSQEQIELGLGLQPRSDVPSPTPTPGGAAFLPNSPTYKFIPTGTTQVGPNATIHYPIAYPYLGNPNAPVKMEIIDSYSCSYCEQYHYQIFTNIQDEIKAGRVQVIYIFSTETGDFNATPNTYAAICAMQQGKFWPMNDIMYFWEYTYGTDANNRVRLDLAAQHLSLDMNKFDLCMTDPFTANYVAASNSYANQRGLVGTPTIFLFTNGRQMQPPASQSSVGQTPGSVAALSLADLRAAIEAAAAPTAVATASQ